MVNKQDLPKGIGTFTDLILKMRVGEPPSRFSIYIWTHDELGYIGAYVYEKGTQIFKPRLCDLDIGWWRHLFIRA